MKVVTAREMRQIDRKTIESIGISSAVLMERAGVAVAKRIRDIFGKKKTVILAGGGNNGGDGIVTGRELFNSGWNVRVLLLIKEDRLSPDCLTQLRIAKKVGLPVEFRTEISETDLHGAVVVDALLGTGLNKDIEGPMAGVIGFLNSSGVPVVSIDIPSGISSDTGQVMGVAVKADYTVTFGLPKRGHLLYPGADHTGRLIVEDIGFPRDFLISDDLTVDIPEIEWLRSLIPERRRFSHKGDYGHVLIVAGSKGKTGAALMAAKACLRTGAGLVTIGIPESLMDIFQARVMEEMTLPLPDRGDGTLSSKAYKEIIDFLSEKAGTLSIGPGIGVSEDTKGLILDLLRSLNRPCVIDADAINSVEDIKTLRDCKAPLVLTPHPGELAGLILRTNKALKQQPSRREVIQDIEGDRIGKALSFSLESGVGLVLKGVPTVTAGPEGRAFINPTGNPGMAKAGTGDVLTGMISALIAQGLKPLDAAVLGVYLHGVAGDIASSHRGVHSLIASDIIEAIPEAFKRVMAKE